MSRRRNYDRARPGAAFVGGRDELRNTVFPHISDGNKSSINDVLRECALECCEWPDSHSVQKSPSWCWHIVHVRDTKYSI